MLTYILFIEDRELIQNVFSTLMVSNELNHIDYNSFNTIQVSFLRFSF